MIADLFNRRRPGRAPLSAADPIRLFVETLEALEEAPPRPSGGGGRVRALDLFAPAPRLPRSPS